MYTVAVKKLSQVCVTKTKIDHNYCGKTRTAVLGMIHILNMPRKTRYSGRIQLAPLLLQELDSIFFLDLEQLLRVSTLDNLDDRDQLQ